MRELNRIGVNLNQNGAGAQLESRVVAGRDPGGGRARQRSPLRSCLVRDVREWAERIGRKHER